MEQRINSALLSDRLVCTLMIRLFSHYRKSWCFKKVSIYFNKSYFLFVCDSYTSAISDSLLSRAGYVASNLGRQEIKNVIFPLPVSHSPLLLIDRPNFKISNRYVCITKFTYNQINISLVNIRHNP